MITKEIMITCHPFKRCGGVRELKVPMQFQHNQLPRKPQNVAILSSKNKRTTNGNENESQ
jgi:hypothetical protein